MTQIEANLDQAKKEAAAALAAWKAIKGQEGSTKAMYNYLKLHDRELALRSAVRAEAKMWTAEIALNELWETLDLNQSLKTALQKAYSAGYSHGHSAAEYNDTGATSLG